MAAKRAASAVGSLVRGHGPLLQRNVEIDKEAGMQGHPRGRALRKGRVSELGRIYSVTTVVHNRRPVFSDWRLGRILVDVMRQAERQGRIESLAWVVMPDHLHWLFRLTEGALDELMRDVKSQSGRRINRTALLASPLWQPGYHDRAIRHDQDLQAVARYLVANPLRAGLVRRVGEYPLWDAVWL